MKKLPVTGMEKIVHWRTAGRSFAGVSWLFQRFSAAALLGLLLLHAHYILRSFVSSGTMNYGDLTAVLSRPAVKAAEISLFFFGTLHCMNGLWSVAVIFFRGAIPRKRIRSAIIIAGIVFFCTVSTAILSL